MPYQAFDLTGKTAVVIDGTSGIGRAIALGSHEDYAVVGALSLSFEFADVIPIQSDEAVDERHRSLMPDSAWTGAAA